MGLTGGDIATIASVTSAGSVLIGTLLMVIFKGAIGNYFTKDIKDYEKGIKRELQDYDKTIKKDLKNHEAILSKSLKDSELQISKLTGFEQKHYDILLQEYKEAWEVLVDLSDYLMGQYPEYLNGIKTCSFIEIAEPVRKIALKAKKSLLFMPKHIGDKISNITATVLIEDLKNLSNCAETSGDFSSGRLKFNTLEQRDDFILYIGNVSVNFENGLEEIKILLQEDYLERMKALDRQ